MTLATKTRTIQAIVGAPVDGIYGDTTADAILAKLGHNGGPPLTEQRTITERIMLEIIEHEAIVCEAYRDSAGVWTWGVGVTDASGHLVARYKDHPTTIKRCLEVYEWLLRTKYLPDVFEAFTGHPLTEPELGAALSFHWNTGAIKRADWVQSVKAGHIEQAKVEFLNWSTPKEIIARRKLERALFFDGQWSSDGLVTVYERVRKPPYTPDWSSARQTDVRGILAEVVAAAT